MTANEQFGNLAKDTMKDCEEAVLNTTNQTIWIRINKANERGVLAQKLIRGSIKWLVGLRVLQ